MSLRKAAQHALDALQAIAKDSVTPSVAELARRAARELQDELGPVVEHPPLSSGAHHVCDAGYCPFHSDDWRNGDR